MSDNIETVATPTAETEASVTPPTGGDGFEDLWEAIPEEPKESPPVEEAAKEPEEAAKEPEEAAKEPEEAKDSDEKGPDWLLAMARRKQKQAERRLTELEGQATQLSQAYEQFQAEHKAFIEERKALATLVQRFPTDFSGAFDEMARIAGMDPKKAFEQVAKAKLGQKTEDIREKPPQVPKELLDRLAFLEQKLQNRDQAEQQHRFTSTINDYSTKLYQVIEASDLPLKRILSDPDVQESIPGAVQEWITNDEFRDMPLGEVAKRLDRYWESKDTAAQKRYSARAGSPAGNPEKPPMNGRQPSGSIPSNAESAETNPTREQTEYERLREAGDLLLREFSGD